MKRLLFVLSVLVAGLFAAPEAQAGLFFPANNPDVNWRSFETEHFVIHYYEDNDAEKYPNSTHYTARRVAKYAEVMWPKVCEQFDYFLQEKIHLVIRDQEDYSNGFALYQSDFVTVWSQPLYFPLRGRIDWVPDVLTHEFSHIVSLKANESRGVGTSLAGIPAGGLIEDGRSNVAVGAELPLFMGSDAPFWWTEGGAEFWTHYVGYNDWGSSRDALLRMSVLDPDATLTLDELAVRPDKGGFDGERGYNHGYSIGLYLAEKYGQETYAKFAEASSKGGRFDWDSIIKEVLGITPEEMWAGWLEWARTRYNRQKEEIEAEGLHAGKEIFLSAPEWEKDPEAWAEHDKRYRKKAKEKTGFYNFPNISSDGSVWAKAGSGGITVEFDNVENYEAFSGEYLLDLSKADSDRMKELGEKKSLSDEEQKELDELKDKKEKLKDKAEERKKLSGSIGCFSGGGLPGMRMSFSPDNKWLAVTAAEVKKWYGTYELDGYEWHDIFLFDLETYRTDYVEKEKKLKTKDCGKLVKRVTENARATAPAFSPDGEWIAFLQYGDGTYQLWKVRPDGTDAQAVTDFPDGTLSGEPSWSPDGTQLALYVYRPDRQDIWVVGADGSDPHPVTWDLAEDKDAFWANDGHIYWASDRTGIFNIYKMDPETRKVVQVTNSLGGAHRPLLTKNGHLLYTEFTAFGFKIAGLNKDDFFNKDLGNGSKETAMAGDGVADDDDGSVSVAYELPSDEEASEFLSEEEELPEIESEEFGNRKYNPWWGGLQPPMFVPMVVYEDFNVKAGGEAILWDSAGKHAFIGDVLLGRDREYVLRYLNFMTYPDLFFVYARFDRTIDRGFRQEETDPNTGQLESFVSDIRFRQRVDFWVASANWQVSPRHNLGLAATYRSFDTGLSTDRNIEVGGPWSFGKKGFSNTYNLNASLRYATINTNSSRGAMDVNPRGGREVTLQWDGGWTRLPGFNGQGFDIDDGEKLDAYLFNSYQFAWAEYLAMPYLPYLEHTLQVTFQGGFIDKNVQFNDELFAGGQHPYRAFGDVNVNTQFAGYEPFSLQGETMLMGSVAYRMPIVRDVDRKFGPFYLDSAYFQVFGTVGNLWGFRPRPVTDPQTGQQILRSDVRAGNIREIPFFGLFNSDHLEKVENDYDGIEIPEFGRDYGTSNPNLYEKIFPVAAKNGNRLLSDVGAEVRVRSYVHNYNFWYSFVRVAYGFNRISGAGDVNNDRIIEDLPPADDLVGETEPPGFRFYIGLGTGF